MASPLSSRTIARIDNKDFALRSLLRMAHSIVDFEPLECRRLCRIESEFFAFLGEEIALFRMVVKTARLHLFGPAFDFLRRFLLAACIEPFDHLLVACALLDLRFEIVARYALESEENVVERTIEMIFADIPHHERATFINRASENCIAANANARTARRFPR